MSKRASAPSSPNTLFIIAWIAWAVVSLLFFLLFGAPGVDGQRSSWFLLGINFFETGAFAAAAVYCFRNWRSTQIVSGREVWLWIGVGLAFYTLGNAFFFLWGNVWGLDPAVSLGDFFYISSYIFLAIGMFKAVLPRRLNLEPPQWLIIAGIGLGGILLAYFLNYQMTEPTAMAHASPSPVYVAQEASPTAEETDLPATTAPADLESDVVAPEWAARIDKRLEPLESVVGLLYLVGDSILLVLAATLLVAFWGGRFSQPWKLIAIAAFCLYIADMFFAYAINHDYVEGSLWEIFWTFSAVFFGLAAVVEHEISTKSRRGSRRRRGASAN